ncbi:MAG TPA: 6-bladed beta-propeller [Longimicrobium sp.]|jgi:sugar lactone lactonase YvrE|uniref:6-bladed beta-propeller n=1 Tax=Longimicrobium sp. TaxID=2029185 RepID=UPI002ED8AE27
MESKIRRSIALAACLLLAACGRESASTGFVVDTLPGGRVVASNTGTGAWKQGEGWTLVEELRIGTADGAGPDMFSGIQALQADPLGRVWVADQSTRELRVFGTDGRHVRTVGRKGGGPGEFEGVMGMSWAADGTLWVADANNNRYTVLDTAGRMVAAHRRESGMMAIPWPGGFDRRGRLHDIVPGANFRPMVVRYGPDLKQADTVPIPEHKQASFEIVRDGRTRMSVTVPFAPSREWGVSRGGVWIGSGDAFRVHRLGERGDTVFTIERQYEPVPVTAAERDTALARLKWFTDQGGKLDASRVPAHKPAFEGFFEDDQGYLWVHPYAREGQEGGYDVFDPSGRYLGHVEMPAATGFVQPVVRGNLLYAVVLDDDGIAYVARYRIQGR